MNKRCKFCHDLMSGIRDYSIREVCEDCGGNTTEYSEENQNPKIDKRRRNNA